jgi:hypothetical protein
MTNYSKQRNKPATPLLPVVLIVAGIIILLANFSFLSWGQLFSLLQLWPLALVAIGVDILLKGRYRLAVVASTIVAGAVLYTFLTNISATLPPRSEAIQQPLAGASRAQVTLRSGVNRLHLSGAPLADTLIAGTAQVRRGEVLEQSFEHASGVAQYRLQSVMQGQSFRMDMAERDWQLTLNERVPLSLAITTGVGQNTLDLTNLTLDALTLQTGVGATTLALPAGRSYRATLQTGVGATTVVIPAELGVRLRVGRGVGSFDLTGAFTQVGNVYISSNFDAASERLELDISSGVGTLTVRHQ